MSGSRQVKIISRNCGVFRVTFRTWRVWCTARLEVHPHGRTPQGAWLIGPVDCGTSQEVEEIIDEQIADLKRLKRKVRRVFKDLEKEWGLGQCPRATVEPARVLAELRRLRESKIAGLRGEICGLRAAKAIAPVRRCTGERLWTLRQEGSRCARSA